MGINKVIFGDQTLIDITDTTAVASDVASGKYFYDASGAKTAGTGSGSGTRHYIVQDGQVVNGHTLSCMPTTILTTEISEGVHYLKALTNSNNYGAVWTENYDFSAYDYMVVELLKVDNSYGRMWASGTANFDNGWCVGRGSASSDQKLTAGAAEQLTANGNAGQVWRDKFLLTIPASSNGHYVKLQTSGNGTGSNAGWLNISNLYAVAE